MKVEGTVLITVGEVISPKPEKEGEGRRKEKLKMTLEGSVDAILTAVHEMKRLGSFANFDLQ